MDVVLAGGPVSWESSPANRPAIVRFANGTFKGNLPLSGIQHGIVNHPDLHNPVMFRLSLPKSARLSVEVGSVSGHGGAKLLVQLDGHAVHLDRPGRLARDLRRGRQPTAVERNQTAGSKRLLAARGIPEESGVNAHREIHASEH